MTDGRQELFAVLGLDKAGIKPTDQLIDLMHEVVTVHGVSPDDLARTWTRWASDPDAMAEDCCEALDIEVDEALYATEEALGLPLGTLDPLPCSEIANAMQRATGVLAAILGMPAPMWSAG